MKREHEIRITKPLSGAGPLCGAGGDKDSGVKVSRPGMRLIHSGLIFLTSRIRPQGCTRASPQIDAAPGSLPSMPA